MNDEKINTKNVYHSFMWKLLERVFSQGMNLVIQIVLARLLMPDDFGSLAIIVAVINYATIFVQSGLSTVIVQKEDMDKLDVSTLLTASLFVAGVLYGVLFFTAPYLAKYYEAPILTSALRVLALYLFLSAINAIQSAVLSRKMKFKAIFWRTIVTVPLSGAVSIILAYRGLGIWSLIALNLTNMLGVVIFMSLDKELRFPLRFSLNRAKKLYLFSSKVLLTSLITGFHDSFRSMVIGKKYAKEDLAYYDKAYTYSGYITLIINQSVSSVLLPTFSRQQDNELEIKRLSRRSIKISSFVMFPVLIGVSMICRPLVILVLSQKWADCVPFLMLFCILRIPGCITSVDKQVYYALGRSELNLYYELGLFATNIVTLLFTMRISTMAIAIGATIVEIIGAVATGVISAKTYKYYMHERISDLWKPLFNSAVMATLVWSVQYLKFGNSVTLIIQIIVGVIAYVFMAKVTKDENLWYLLNIIKKIVMKDGGQTND